MQRRPTPLELVLVLLSAVACGPSATKAPGTTAPGDTDGPGLVSIATPQGAPLAPSTKVVISPAGGTLSTNDGSLRVTVPAGAVATPTEFTITAIANTARGAVGPAFRLGPEGTTFRVPVLLTFKAPAQYPTGTSIAGVGVEYQDDRGFWHRVDPVVRNATSGTVAVATTHFSDWALTWQVGTAAAEGPIKLTQTVGIPFTAQGRATLYLQGDTAAETVYLLTGTLTVPATIKVDGVDCTPDAVTKTLPLNVAEIKKGSPPVFRWGIGVTWTLSCPGPGDTVTTHLLPALFDTMYINLTRCGGYYEAGQIVEAGHLKGEYTKNCGIEGTVSGMWDLRTCVPDAACMTEADCRLGVTVCTDGVASCVESGVAENGTSCGPGDAFVCSESICVDPKDASTGIVIDPTAPLATAEPAGTATFTVALATQPTTDVTVGLSSTNTAEGTVNPESLVFTPGDWNVPQTVTVTGKDDSVVDGDQPYTIVTAPGVSGDPRYSGFKGPDVTVSNADDDVPGILVSPESGLVTGEAGASATFTVVMRSQPVADVVVPLSIPDASEGVFSDPIAGIVVSSTAITFTPANWNVARTVTVAGVDDFVADGPQPYAVVAGPVSSADPVYEGRDVPDVAVTNSDDDSAGITVSPTSGLQTHERGDLQTFTVVLNSEPTAVVTIPVTSADPGEGTVSPAALVFTSANWDIPQIVSVSGVDDFVADGTIPYAAKVGPADSADLTYHGSVGSDVALLNADDDSAGITLSRVSGLLTTESGATDTFTLRLTSEPTGDVTIALSSTRPEEGAVLPASVTFTAANWSTAQTVTVTGVDDFVVEGNQPYAVVTAPATSADPNYQGFDAPDVEVVNNDNDTVGIVVTPTTALQTSEAGGTATFTVALRSQPLADVTVPIASRDTSEATVAPAGLTFTAATWNQPQTVTVTGVNDAIADGAVGYAVAVGPATSTDLAYQGLTAADVTLTNADDADVAGLLVTPSGGLVTGETGATATFTVALQSEPTSDVTIALASSNTGEGTVSPPVLTFTAASWSTAQSVTVTGVDDAVDDGDRAYTIAVTATSADTQYARAVDVSVTNVDNDTAGFSVSAISGATSEAGGSAAFQIVLTSQPTAQVEVGLSSSDTTEGTVSPASAVFTAANWNVAQTITVTGVNDALADGNVAYQILTAAAISADPSYSGANAPDVAVSNTDDDFAQISVSGISRPTAEDGTSGAFQIVLTSEPTAQVTIALTSSDTTEGTVSPASVIFTAANWNIAQTVTVTGVNDFVADGPVSYEIRLAPAVSADSKYSGMDAPDVTVSNADDDAAGISVSSISRATGEDGTSAAFQVVLTSEPTAQVEIALTSSDTTEGTVAPASAIFTAANWNTPQTITVTGVDDFVADGPVDYAIRTAPAISADPGYSGRDALDVAVANADDDVAGVTVSPTSGLATTEAGGSDTFTIVLTSEPTSDVTIALSSSDPTEATVPLAVTFTSADWNVPHVVTVTGVDDVIDDGSQPFTIVTEAAVSADLGYAGRPVADVTGANANDDTAGITVTAASGLTTTEAGGTATFTIVLTAQPTADVAISLTSNDTTEGTVAPASVTFTPSSWNVPQTVTATGVDDGADDGDRAYVIVTSAASSTDAAYQGREVADVSITNLDNDAAGISVSAISGATSEAGTSAAFQIVLTSQPASDVEVALTSSDTGEGTVSLASAVFTAANWNIAQTITVAGVDDAVDDGDITYAIPRRR